MVHELLTMKARRKTNVPERLRQRVVEADKAGEGALECLLLSGRGLMG